MALENSSENSATVLDLDTYSSWQNFAVWKYFCVKKNKSGAAEHVTSKLCAQKAVHSGGRTNFRNHLQTNHHK